MRHPGLVAAVVPLVVFSVYGQEDGSAASPPAVPAPSASSAPAAQPPSPEAEQALRARVRQYFEDCAQRKYREAEGLLDEPSKDLFYDAAKPQYNSFDEITKIEWSENFTHASVTVRAAMDIPMQTFVIHGHPLVPTEWRLIDGQWYMHINTPEEGIRMPMIPVPVKIPASQVAKGTQPPPPPGGMTSFSTKEMRAKAEELLHGVKADRSFVELDSTRPGEQKIRLRNTTPGPVDLTVVLEELPGLTAKLDKRRIGPNEIAVATVLWKPKDKVAKPVRTLHVRVLPLGQDIPIQVRFNWNPVRNESASIPK